MVAGGRTGGREDKGTASVFTVYDGAEASQMAPRPLPKLPALLHPNNGPTLLRPDQGPVTGRLNTRGPTRPEESTL